MVWFIPLIAAAISAGAGAASNAARARKQSELTQNLNAQGIATSKMGQLGQGPRSISDIGTSPGAPENNMAPGGGFSIGKLGELMQPGGTASGPSGGSIAAQFAPAAASAALSAVGGAGVDPAAIESSAIGQGGAGMDQISDIVKTPMDMAGQQTSGLGISAGPAPETGSWSSSLNPALDAGPAPGTWGTADTQSGGIEAILSKFNNAPAPGGEATSMGPPPGGTPPVGMDAPPGDPNSWGALGKMLLAKAGSTGINMGAQAAMNAALRRKKPAYNPAQWSALGR